MSDLQSYVTAFAGLSLVTIGEEAERRSPDRLPTGIVRELAAYVGTGRPSERIPNDEAAVIVFTSVLAALADGTGGRIERVRKMIGW